MPAAGVTYDRPPICSTFQRTYRDRSRRVGNSLRKMPMWRLYAMVALRAHVTLAPIVPKSILTAESPHFHSLARFSVSPRRRHSSTMRSGATFADVGQIRPGKMEGSVLVMGAPGNSCHPSGCSLWRWLYDL